jgi:hypothetical protein
VISFLINLETHRREVLVNYRRQSSQSRVELGLGLSYRRTRADVWIVDAQGYGSRFIVHANDKLTAFMELQSAIHEFAVDLIS